MHAPCRREECISEYIPEAQVSGGRGARGRAVWGGFVIHPAASKHPPPPPPSPQWEAVRPHNPDPAHAQALVDIGFLVSLAAAWPMGARLGSGSPWPASM